MQAKPPLRPDAPHPTGPASITETFWLNFSFNSSAAFRPVNPPPIIAISFLLFFELDSNFGGRLIVCAQ